MIQTERDALHVHSSPLKKKENYLPPSGSNRVSISISNNYSLSDAFAQPPLNSSFQQTSLSMVNSADFRAHPTNWQLHRQAQYQHHALLDRLRTEILPLRAS